MNLEKIKDIILIDILGFFICGGMHFPKGTFNNYNGLFKEMVTIGRNP